MSIFDSLFSSVADEVGSLVGGNQIGSFGDIVFEVSSFGPYVKTITDYSRDAKAQLATHNVIGQKPVVEFLGPDIDSIKFKMIFSIAAGITNPEDEVNKLREMMQTGEAAYLILNGKPMSDYKFIIESISETVKAFNGNGKIISASVDISAKEYVEDLPVIANAANGTEGNNNG